MRGEGGQLLRPDGTRFMDEYDPRGELAPRDIVARAIDDVMKRLGGDCVYLDISHKPAEFIAAHFPNIHATCLELRHRHHPGADPGGAGGAFHLWRRAHRPARPHRRRQPVRGGRGRLHRPARRQPSGVAIRCWNAWCWARAAADDIAARLDALPPPPDLPAWDESWVTDSDEEVVVAHNWDEIRRFMWDYVGIVRSTKRLERAQHRVKLLLDEIDEYYGSFRVTNDLLELRNIAMVADLIVRSALARRESRGLHYTIDFPARDLIAPPQNTILVPKNFSARRAQDQRR